MAELKRTFSAGVMNKDLDERLLPSGQYRDALNVQVSTSEGSDVGALQNILGNELPYSSSIAANLGENAVCIGSIRKDDTECVYWFVASSTKSLVVEFNQSNSTVTPILVDTKRVIKLDRDNLITGVEILDDFLMWTDNKSEPKMIKISDWKGYTAGAWTHTQVGGGDFKEKHCTVIKENPKYPPSLKMAKTTRTGPISSTLNSLSAAFGGYSFTYINEDGEWEPVPTGDYTDQNGDGTADPNNYSHDPTKSQIKVSGTAPDFRPGDKLKLTLLDNGEDEDESEVILSVLQTYPQDPKLFKISVDAVSTEIKNGKQNWKIELIQKPALFPTKFVRFAYRWKFENGQYSTISPFSTVAFIPDSFDYDSKKGYNLGMVNQLRKLEIRDFSPSSLTGMYAPYDVVEVDILYKDSVSSNIYVVKSIKTTDPEYVDSGSFLDAYSGRLEIESELVYKLIPSNQILRPYDNVPKRAKALSVSGNRLMFGNYTENYDMVHQGKDITVRFAVNVSGADYPVSTGIQSIKSQRTYQVGVVYRDKYGRETPVFTDTTGSITLNKGFAETRNSMTVRITSPMPDWAESYKYYIKETSQPYHNMAMDRHYPAEDGNVWISFPSSERNKIQEEEFITLKKEHDSDQFVADEAKYKVIAINNEAPDFIKEEKVSKGKLNRDLIGDGGPSIFGSSRGWPVADGSYIDIRAEDWQEVYGGSGDSQSTAVPVHQLNDLLLRIYNKKNQTKYYEIANVQYRTAAPPYGYRVNLVSKFEEQDVAFIGRYNANDTETSIEIFQKEIKRKPEFQGRFFAKIQKDVVLEKTLLKTESIEDYRIVNTQPIYSMPSKSGKDWWRSSKDRYPGETADPGNISAFWFFDVNSYFEAEDGGGTLSINGEKWRGGTVRTAGEMKAQGHGCKSGSRYIEISRHQFGSHNKFGRKDNKWELEWVPFADSDPFAQQIEKIGSKFRFTDDDDKDENIYTITGYRRTFIVAYDDAGLKKNIGKTASSRICRWTLQLDKDIDWAPGDNGFTTAGNSTVMEFLKQFTEDAEASVSSNPAIFETEPKEVADLDIYYEASQAYGRLEHGSAPRLPYSNCYSFGNGVESDRIRDDFNAPTVGKGVRASSVLDEQYKEVNKKSDIIYSGIYNSTSGVNRLNQFIQAEQITKSINPAYGSIQLMQFRLGKLDVYLEDNVVSILSDKDALFNADGSKNVVASTNVLGSIQPYAGDFGISKNPESYARYGNRAYFSDKNRGVILRLSGNGLEPISRYGMDDYFRDKLSEADQVIGSYDENKKEYALTLVNNSKRSEYDETVTFKESVNGWNSKKSYIQENGLSLNNKYYTFKGGEIWSHTNETRNNFYGEQYNSSVKFIFNDAPGSVKSFKTLNYEGSQARIFVDSPDSDNKFENRLAKPGWWVESIESDLQSGQVKTFKDKEGKWFYNILGTETTAVNLDTKEYSVQGLGLITEVQGVQGQEVEIIVE